MSQYSARQAIGGKYNQSKTYRMCGAPKKEQDKRAETTEEGDGTGEVSCGAPNLRGFVRSTEPERFRAEHRRRGPDQRGFVRSTEESSTKEPRRSQGFVRITEENSTKEPRRNQGFVRSSTEEEPRTEEPRRSKGFLRSTDEEANEEEHRGGVTEEEDRRGRVIEEKTRGRTFRAENRVRGTPRPSNQAGAPPTPSNEGERKKEHQVSRSWWNANNDDGREAKQSKQSTIRRTKQKPTLPQWWRLTFWRKTADECGGGPTKTTIVDNIEVAEVVNNGKVRICENKAQSGTNNNNQPIHNGGDLPCGGRQPLNAVVCPPNPPSSTFLELRKLSKKKK